MIISRALLESESCTAFIALLESQQRAGVFHYTVADKHSRQPYSVEAPFQGVSLEKVNSVAVHANHLVHQQQSHIRQIITESSQCRQNRMEALAAHHADAIDEEKCFDILQDIEANALPIFRTAEDDPDEENTLATGVFSLSATGVAVTIYGMEDFSHPHKTQFVLE